MSSYYIRDAAHAAAIIAAYQKCRNCGECDLNSEGWKCSYIYEQAQKYIKNHPANSAAQHKGD